MKSLWFSLILFSAISTGFSQPGLTQSQDTSCIDVYTGEDDWGNERLWAFDQRSYGRQIFVWIEDEGRWHDIGAFVPKYSSCSGSIRLSSCIYIEFVKDFKHIGCHTQDSEVFKRE